MRVTENGTDGCGTVGDNSTPKMLALINTIALEGVKVEVWGYKWPNRAVR
jgi:hypothetical protein